MPRQPHRTPPCRTGHARLKRALLLLGLAFPFALSADCRGTGDLGVVIERMDGAVGIIETTHDRLLGEVQGLGDLSHASTVFSHDERYAFVFGRDGGLTKIDLLEGRIVRRILQAGNSIGGAITQDGRFVAVSNYRPGGVRIFRSDTLEPVADIPAEYAPGKRSRVVGLVDAPGNRLVFSLWDAGEIWVAQLGPDGRPVRLRKFRGIGRQPYDGLITPDGRYYLAGLFGEDGMALLDLWNLDAGVRRILPHYGRGERRLPVYKMPHLEGWAIAGREAWVPAVGHHAVLVVDTLTWKEVARIPVHGQPVFVMARPDGRQVWVNFAFPDNDTIQVIDTPTRRIVKTLRPGKAVLHMEFEPRGEEVWVSVRDRNRVLVYDTRTFRVRANIPIRHPSGIFLTARAHRTGL
ncbi:MAG: protein nirF [Gammaproteobacteria bacterium]|nr:MAG: protein nirF [Gammaproteobacteria bacterium]